MNQVQLKLLPSLLISHARLFTRLEGAPLKAVRKVHVISLTTGWCPMNGRSARAPSDMRLRRGEMKEVRSEEGEMWGLFRAFPSEGAVVWRDAPHLVIMQCGCTATQMNQVQLKLPLFSPHFTCSPFEGVKGGEAGALV
jgi:hypothetical protein